VHGRILSYAMGSIDYMEIEYYSGNSFFNNENIFLNKALVDKPTGYHSHDFIEIAYVASGNGIHKIDKNEYLCSAGSIYILNFDVAHQFIPDTEAPMIIYNCVFKPDFFDYKLINSRSFSDVTHNFLLKPFLTEELEYFWDISLTGKTKLNVNRIYEQMLEEFIGQEDGFVEILRAYLIQMLVLIFRFIKNTDKRTYRASKEKSRVIDNVIEYIENNFAKGITLDELAMKAFLSPAHFCRQFKEHTGITAKEFMQKARIDEACRLLKTTSLKIIEISTEVGYQDIKHFNMIFKRIKGESPSDYRNS
jgi:AraC family transcriptional regulator, L-rhamnose operon transcriptional activator RhaR